MTGFFGYKHWTLEETPRCFYVGKGLARRPRSRHQRNHKWHAVVKSLGLRVEVCTGPLTNDEACAWEVANILSEGTFSESHSHHDISDIGCNFTRGGEGAEGYKHTPDAIAKMKVAQVGSHRVFSDEHRANIRAARIGKRHSVEACLNMSRSHRGKTSPNKGKKFVDGHYV